VFSRSSLRSHLLNTARQLDPDSLTWGGTEIGSRSKSPVPTHLRQAVDELLERNRKPACVLINGDLALKDGQPGDYRHFARLIEPLHKAKLDVHLTLGNHDNRKAFYDVMQNERPKTPLVVSRHISVVKTRFANFFLLDSLKKTWSRRVRSEKNSGTGWRKHSISMPTNRRSS
jgi:3',5'-cyclic AMP phosphodiesterase CpdA